MIAKAVILAGGLGTRLKPVSGDRPKPLVDEAGKPFIYHLIMAISFRSDLVMEMLGDRYREARISYSVEKEPMGTGGAIAQALTMCTSRHVQPVNGDTFLEIDLPVLEKGHLDTKNKLIVG